MKSFSKRVASFAMAAAMVCSLAVVSPVDAEAAAKPAFEKTRSAIKAGTNYTYAVKNVTSKQYVKVYATTGIAVKNNNKKVTKGTTKLAGGKTIKVKINANEKVANYKGKVTVKVFNKKTNKKVKDLSDSFTVKCTQLAVNNVTVASTSGKYLVATFNKALTSLSAADIEIRSTETNELKGVERVDLASDGKSANITLVGSESNGFGAVNQFVEPNKDYTFTVTQKGVTATTSFRVDAVAASASVVEVDKTNRKIGVENVNSATGSAKTFTIPTTITVDFDKLIGSTVTVQYDKNNVVTKLTAATETVVEGAFESVSANTASATYLKDLATGTKYYLQEKSGDLSDTVEIRVNNAGYHKSPYTNGSKDYYTSVNATVAKYAYAKLTLNNNGTIKTIVGDKVAAFTDKLLVDKVVETTASAATKTVVNLKDYLILEKGTAVAPADLVGKVVFYDTNNKFAVAYTESKTGALEAVYDGKFKFNGTIYNTADANYADGANGVKKASNDYMNSLLAGKKDITVYFDLAGKPAFITGTTAAVVTNEKTIVLTKNAETYNAALKDIVRLTGSDGKTAVVKDVDVANLTSVTTAGNNTFKKKNAVSANASGGDVTGFKAVSFNDAANAAISVSYNNSENTILDLNGNDTDLAKMDVIKVTEDTNGNVVGISAVASVGTVSGDFVAGKSSFTVGALNKGLQIKSSTPVYFYNTTTNAVSSTTYGEYTSKATNDNVTVYSANQNDIDCVVVTATESAALTYVKAVVASTLKNTDGKIASLTTITGKETKTYEKFSDNVKNNYTSTLTNGAVVLLGIASDGATVEDVKTDSASIGTKTPISVSTNTVNQNDSSFKNMTGSTTYTLASSEKSTITVAIIDGEVYKVATFSDLMNISNSNSVDVYTMGNTAYIDTIVIKTK